MQLGLQTGFGELTDPVWLLRVKDQNIDVCRISGQQGHVEQSAIDCEAMAFQIHELGMTPIITVQSAYQVESLSSGTLIEHFNEGDITSNRWDSTQDMRRMYELIDATKHRYQLYVGGSVSGLHKRGFDFLKKFKWSEIPSDIGCSIHRYPHGNSWLNATPSGSFFSCNPKSRAEEVKILKSIIGNRPLAITEVGYCDANWTLDQQNQAYQFERMFWNSVGADLVVAYQMTDGLLRDCENTYGAFYASGQVKPWVQSFIQGSH